MFDDIASQSWNEEGSAMSRRFNRQCLTDVSSSCQSIELEDLGGERRAEIAVRRYPSVCEPTSPCGTSEHHNRYAGTHSLRDALVSALHIGRGIRHTRPARGEAAAFAFLPRPT